MPLKHKEKREGGGDAGVPISNRDLELNATVQDPALNILEFLNVFPNDGEGHDLTELCALDKQTRPLRSSGPCGEVWLFPQGAGPLLRLAGLKGCERCRGDSWALESTAAAAGDEEKLSKELLFFFFFFFTGNCLFSVKGRLR